MTSLPRVVALLGEFDEKLLQRLRDAEENREKERKAATAIQAAYRSHLVRKRLAFKAQCLVRLQTFFRGWVGRNEATAKRRDRDRELRKAYFDLCATTIQRHWRGHYSRINIHDFQARKAYLQAVVEKGKQVREESTLLAEDTLRLQALEEEHMQHERTLRQMQRMHHLVSTAAQPGVLSNPYMAMMGQSATIGGRPAEDVLKNTAKGALTLPPLKLRGDVVRPQMYKLPRQQVGTGATLRCGDLYQHNDEHRKLDAAVSDALWRTLHPAPFRNSLARPPRVLPNKPLISSMRYDPTPVLQPRSERLTDKARSISKVKWTSATHRIEVFDTSIV